MNIPSLDPQSCSAKRIDGLESIGGKSGLPAFLSASIAEVTA